MSFGALTTRRQRDGSLHIKIGCSFPLSTNSDSINLCLHDRWARFLVPALFIVMLAIFALVAHNIAENCSVPANAVTSVSDARVDMEYKFVRVARGTVSFISQVQVCEGAQLPIRLYLLDVAQLHVLGCVAPVEGNQTGHVGKL
jgi:hypothetical protein